MLVITHVDSREELGHVRSLFEEYAASLNISLDFQGFDGELAGLPGEYALPTGRLLLARDTGAVAGCVALRRIDDAVCEMKRLYVRPRYQGAGVGRRLAEAVIAEARRASYTTMKLDTLPSMQAAIALYESLGFGDTAPYRHNPIAGSRFLALPLHPA